MYYDKKNKIMWMRAEIDVTNIGPVYSISGSFITEKGFIEVNCFSLRETYSNYASIFNSVFLSLSPDSTLAYKPKWSDSLPLTVVNINWGRVIEKGMLGLGLVAILCGIVALWAFLKKGLGCQFIFVYILMSLVQLLAILNGIEAWWGWPTWIAIFIAMPVAYIPILGTIVGIMGAIKSFGWSPTFSIWFFCWPYVLYTILLAGGGLSSIFSRNKDL
jgi:hypothetical protein